MSPTTVAQQLIGLLQQAGVDTIYGMTGDAVFPFFDALGKQSEVTGTIRFVGTSDETSAAFMVSYHAKLTGKLGVCISTAGPGVANLVNGLADAYFDHAPVLAITGQVALNKMGIGTKQDINQQQLLQAVTASSQLVTAGEMALHIVARAIERAIRQSTVAHVSIPEDVFHHTVSSPLPAIDLHAFSWRGGGYAGSRDEAVAMLQGAHNPFIVVGARDRQLRDQIENMAERIGAGLVVAQQAKGIFPDDHPRVLGGIGEAYIPAIVPEVDCIVLVGVAPFEIEYFSSDVNTIQLVERPGMIDYSRTNHALVGNIGDSLTGMLEKLQPMENAEWQQKIRGEKENRNNMIDEQCRNRKSPMHPGHVMTVLNEIVPPDAVIVCDIGAYVHWFDSYFKADQHIVLGSSHWRSLGAGVPGALSVALQQPDRRVVALVGDGGMMASLGVLCTAVQHKIPVTIVVANNHHYEIERVRMEHKGLQPFGVATATPDFAALAAGFGAMGKTVQTSDELEATLRESLASEGPVVLDVQLARAELPFLAHE